MITVRKKNQKVQAWQLGTGTKKEKELIQKGLIVLRDDGNYEVFSREAAGKHGESARPFDYFKVDNVDGTSFPYPNDREFFEAKHELLGNNWYLQKADPVMAWNASMNRTDSIDWLLESGRLEIHQNLSDKYFQAELWGTRLYARQNAWIVIYGVKRNSDGSIADVDFNFVDNAYFQQNYEPA